MKNLMKTAQRVVLFVLGTLIAMEVITLAILKERHLGLQEITCSLIWLTSMLFLPLLGYYLYKETNRAPKIKNL